MKKINILLLALLAGCAYEFPDPDANVYTPNAGSANLTKYVAVGNSITAGYMDGALYQEGQDGAFPQLIWNRMKEVNEGISPFISPDVNTEIGYSTEIPGLGVLGRLRFDDPSLSPIYDPAFPAEGECSGDSYTPKPMLSDITQASYFAPTGIDVSTMGNFGIPGIQLGQFLTPATGNPTPDNPAFNPYYIRFASAPTQSSPISDVLSTQPSFFTFWLGANDVLGYASSGGLIPLTDPGAFENMYQVSLTNLVNSGAQGVIATIPNLLRMPYFSLVTEQIAAVTFPLDQANADALNGAYALQGFTNVNFTEGSNNRLLIETGTGDIRQFIPGEDFITLRMALDGQTSKLGTNPVITCGQQVGQGDGMGVADFVNTVSTSFGEVPAAYPIPNQYVLDKDEYAAAASALASYNASIRSTASLPTLSGNLALADVAASFDAAFIGGLRDPNSDLTLLTVSVSAGGGVSTDGLHPNPRGHAWLANIFMEAINAKFGSNLRSYDLMDFRGNEFPVP